MSVIKEQFEKLRVQSRTAFMPFITAGDPDLAFTRELLLALDHAGCHLVELGFPYSDPIADGPVIQASYTRALRGGVTVNEIIKMVSKVSSQIKMPIVAMVSYALIFRFGREKFVKTALDSGISGAIVPDLPTDESEDFARLCNDVDFDLVHLITPTTPDERAIRIASSSNGFIYYVSIAGITGERTELPAELKDRLAWLRQQTETPVCVGFGINEPEQANMLSQHSDGIIVGSAIVKRIAAVSENGDRESVLASISDFAKQMIAAVQN